MMALNLYVQQESCYPFTDYVFTALQPYAGPLPTQNYDYKSTPPRYLGQQQSVYLCPGFSHLRGEVGGEPNLTSYAYNIWGSSLSQPSDFNTSFNAHYLGLMPSS